MGRRGLGDVGAPGTGYVRRSGRGDDLYWTKTPVTLGSTDIPNLVVALTKSTTLSGRLVYETTRTTIESVPVTRRRPAPDARANGADHDHDAEAGSHADDLRRAGRRIAEPRSAAQRPLPDGAGTASDSFRLEGLKGGRANVIRCRPAPNDSRSSRSPIGGADYTNKPIDGALLGRAR
jgi:hypothetical protein